MPTCYDSNGNIQDCASATASSLCFDDQQNEVDCSSYSFNTFGGPPVPTDAQTTGLLAASSRNGNTALTTAITQLGTVAAQTYAKVQAPSTAVRIGPSGVAVPQSSLSIGLLVALAAVLAFVVFKSK